MDPSRVEVIYDQLGEFVIHLDADSWSMGPKYLHDLISKTRGYLNNVSFILQEILREKQSLDRSKHAAQAAFQVESDRLLAEDDRVRRLPNIDDRKATVNLICRDRLSEIATLDAQLLDLSYVEKAVRHRFQELKATMSDIRVQRALLRDAVDTGSFYGDETDTPRAKKVRPSQEAIESDIDEVMQEVDSILLGEASESSDEATPDEPVAQDAAVAQVEDYSDVLDDVSLESETPQRVVEVKEAQPKTEEDEEIEGFLDDDDLADLLAD